MSAGEAPVWSAIRTTSDGPPRLIIELASCVAMISRRSRCFSSASGNLSAIMLGEIAAQLAAEIGIVRHLGIEQRRVERQLGIGQQHRELRPGQRLRAAARARRARVSSGRNSTARSSSPAVSKVCISRCWKPKSSMPRRSASDSASVCR